MAKYLSIGLWVILSLVACQPTPDVFTPPKDPTVDRTLIENYVNKLYFSLLGREPSATEATDAITALSNSNMADSVRRNIIEQIQKNPDYFVKLAAEARNDYLNGLTSADIDKKNHEMYGWMFDGLVDSAFSVDLTNGIKAYNELNLSAAQLEAGTITIAEMHRRCVTNYTYSQINMGTDNFIKSCFNNFLFRYPTEYELREATNMVDGGEGTLFYEKGSGRNGFLDIFFNSDNYYEGLIINLYRKNLLRTPEPVELAAYLKDFRKHHSFYKLQENILASDEYAGLFKYIPDAATKKQ